MKRKAIILGVVIVAGTAFFTGTRGRLNTPDQDVVPAGPSAATLRYWQDASRLFRNADETSERIGEELARFRSGRLTTAAELRDFWRGCADLYNRSAEDCRSAVSRIQELPRQDADEAALRLGSAAVDYLKLRGELHRHSAADCKEYAALHADVTAAGGMIDEATPAGKKFVEREEAIRSKMIGRAADGQKKRRR